MSDATQIDLNKITLDSPKLTQGPNIEFFHIYTDEKISEIHAASLDYVRQVRDRQEVAPSTIIMIDNYNPTEHILLAEDVFTYLENNNELPDYWAYEGDLVTNAQQLLENFTSPKLKGEYERYIAKRGKYPCSLLTASWYLTRLGYLNHQGVIRRLAAEIDYQPVSRIINILPEDYKSVESRARDIIKHSNFAQALNDIDYDFYAVELDKDVKLF